MISTKNSLLSGRCQTLRDHSARLSQSFSRVADQRDGIADEIDNLSRQILSTKDPQELQRLNNLQRDVHNQFKLVDREYQSLLNQLQAAGNDYEITGCRPILGPLNLGYQ